MKKQFTNVASVIALSLFSVSTFAQTDKTVNQVEKRENGTTSFISFKESANYKSSDYQTLFKTQLGLKQNQNFSKLKSESDNLGFTHEKFQLYHQGIKVEFATYSIHSKNGKVSSMNGEFYNIGSVDVNPSISANVALQRAKANIGASKYLWENPIEAQALNYETPTGELVILPVDGNKFRLAYKFDIYATTPVSRGDIYIDAKTGESLLYNATIKHLGEHSHGKGLNGSKVDLNMFKSASMPLAAGTAATRYSGSQSIETTLSGTQYILSDALRGGGVRTYNSQRVNTYTSAVDFKDTDNNWTAAEFNNTNKDNGALDAHWGAEKTYDYWKNIHGRNSFNNAGAQIKSYVHYNLVSDGYPDNNNAFWNGSVMTYGDGSGTGGFDILTALDVCGHEIGHAVCSNTSNLAYQKESGAMNEGFSDIWAACIENYAAPTKQIWLIGEDIERRTGHSALRSMSNPKAEGQPDTYGGTNWRTVNCTPSNANDQCGVHTNSGVLNHWFYILSVGKSGTNDKGSAYNVTGITIAKAEKIAFRLESVYLTANSTYANARTGAISAATDLYGAGSPEVIATTNAWYAVGVGAAYVSTDSTAPTAPTGLIASGTTSTTTNLSWTAATDNVGVTGYDIYQGAVLKGSSATTSFAVTGLTASTTYSFTVKAKDAAGNISAASTAVSVTTSASVADTTAPTAPTGLTASGTTSTSTNLSWTAATDNVGVTGYDIYQGTTLKGSSTTTSFAVTGLTASTAYLFTVKAKDAAGNVSAASTAVSVTTLAATTTPTYCTTKGTSQTDEWIDYVALNGMTNTTAANAGYGNFTATKIAPLPYGSNTLTISAGFASTAYTEYWAIWIDYNQNGTFESTELIDSGSSSSSGNLTSTFTVPTTATAGRTRMRISMKYGSAPTACETFSYGEVEDYTVNVGSSTPIMAINEGQALANESNVYDFEMYPNPVENSLNISMLDGRKVSYRVHNLMGQIVINGELTQPEINVSNLPSGIYVIDVNDGQKSITKKFLKK